MEWVSEPLREAMDSSISVADFSMPAGETDAEPSTR